jgi:hypothetical protein
MTALMACCAAVLTPSNAPRIWPSNASGLNVGLLTHLWFGVAIFRGAATDGN